jgi:hypothetical protein
VLFIAIEGKSYFLAPAYPPLYAGGAVLLSEWRVGFRRWVAVYPVVLAISSVLLAPAAMPVLPPTVYGQISILTRGSGSRLQPGCLLTPNEAVATFSGSCSASLQGGITRYKSARYSAGCAKYVPTRLGNL